MLHTGNFRNIDPGKYDEIWLCVRSLKAMPKNPEGNIKHVPVLSPSSKLFRHFLDLQKRGMWDRKAFEGDFAPAFMKEMLEPAALAKLKELAELSKAKEILVVCYCHDETLCHRSLLKLIIQTMNQVDRPVSQGPVLEDYQLKCKKFIIDHPKCGVFLDIGYGKTLTTIDAISDLKLRNVLVVAPKAIARTTWHAEVRKWNYPFECYSMVEKKDKKGKDKIIPMKELVPLYEAIPHTRKGTTHMFITSRDRVKHLVDWCEAHDVWPFDMIVCDEFQSFKSGTAQRTKAIELLASKTKRLVGLTGTPMPNSLQDIWSEVKILDGGMRLGKYITHFRERYMHSTMVVNGHAVGWKPNYGAEEEVFAKIRDITISVKTDLKLPPLKINDVSIQLSDDDMRLYNDFARKGVLDLESIDQFAAFKSGLDDTVVTPANAAVLASKLLQIASGTIYDAHHNVYDIHNQKIAMSQYICDNTGGNVMIAYHFQCDLDKLLKLDPGDGNKCVVFDGSEAMKDAWNRGEYKIMMIQPASNCHGINLQEGGSTLIWYSIPWSLEHYLQTNGRLYRKGQTKPTCIHRLIAKDTFDEKVAAALLNKNFGNDMLLEMVRREIQAIAATA